MWWEDVGCALAMASHPRLGSGALQPVKLVSTSADLLHAIMKHVALVVPDDVPTLEEALKRAGAGQVIQLRGQIDLCASVHVDRPVHLRGEAGAVIRGMLVLRARSGSVSDVRIDDAGDCCIRVERGHWELQRLRLRCCHAAALHVSGAARVGLRECIMGGDQVDEVHEHGRVIIVSAYGSVQEAGLTKRACYGVVATEDAKVVVNDTRLLGISEAALLVATRAHVWLTRCVVSATVAALMAGRGRGRGLELSDCSFSVQRLWADADRVPGFIWGVGNSVTTVSDKDDEPATRLEQPRGNVSDDSSTESLDEQEFADMERLMEQLDDAVLEGGTG